MASPSTGPLTGNESKTGAPPPTERSSDTGDVPTPTEPDQGPTPAPRVRTGRLSAAKRRSIVRGFISVVVVLAVWEAAVRIFEPSTVIIVAPSAIPPAFWALAETGELWTHFRVSMKQFLLGYVLASALAIPLGLWMGASRRAHDYGDPWLTALYATPNVALAPLFIIWLGFGDTSHVAIIALVAFFPVIINTIDGVHAVERDLREVGIAFRANKREVFALVDLPGAMPYIFTGLRLAMARALVGIVVADLFGAQAGLGYLILTSAQLFATADVFVGVLILAALGVGLTFLLRAMQKKLTPWQIEVKEQV